MVAAEADPQKKLLKPLILALSGRSLLAIAVNHYANFAYTEFGAASLVFVH